MKITQQLLEQFYNYYKNQNFKPDTIENYRRDFSEFMGLFTYRGYSEIEEIKLPIIEEWRTILKNTKVPKKSIYYGKNEYLSERTIQCKVQSVKKFLEFVNTIYEIGMDYRKIDIPKYSKPKMDYLTKSEFDAFVKIVEQKQENKEHKLRSLLLIKLAYYTGMRLAELLSVKVEDILKDTKMQILGKGEVWRTVYYPPEIQEMVKNTSNIGL